MRILHLHSGNLYGGVERVLGAMARSSSSSGMEPVFALSHEGRIAAEIRAAGAKVHILGPVRASRPLTILAARARVAALCRGGGFDAVIAHSAWSMALLGPAITEAFKNAKFTGYPRVSSARPAPVSALGDWIVCLTSDAESERRIYALFIRDNAIVDGRLAVVIDDCTEETFAPLPGR